eukprot:Gb_26676 [translate_table: standard]
MKKLKDMLKIGPNDKSFCTVGIRGMGWMGKTTPPEAVFNDIKPMFNARVRAKESKKGLIKLQLQILIKGLLKIKLEMNSVDEGKPKMRGHDASNIHLISLNTALE